MSSSGPDIDFLVQGIIASQYLSIRFGLIQLRMKPAQPVHHKAPHGVAHGEALLHSLGRRQPGDYRRLDRADLGEGTADLGAHLVGDRDLRGRGLASLMPSVYIPARSGARTFRGTSISYSVDHSSHSFHTNIYLSLPARMDPIGMMVT